MKGVHGPKDSQNHKITNCFSKRSVPSRENCLCIKNINFSLLFTPVPMGEAALTGGTNNLMPEVTNGGPAGDADKAG